MNTQINSINHDQDWEKWLLVKATDNVKKMLEPIINFLQGDDEVCEITILNDKFDILYNQINDLLIKSENSNIYSFDESENIVEDIVDLTEIALEIEVFSHQEQIAPMQNKMWDLLQRVYSNLSLHHKKNIILELQYKFSQFSDNYDWGDFYLKKFNNDF